MDMIKAKPMIPSEMFKKVDESSKEIAIEFAKYILESRIISHTAGDDEGTEEWPIQYQFLLGMLINDDSLWNQFMEEKHGR